MAKVSVREISRATGFSPANEIFSSPGFCSGSLSLQPDANRASKHPKISFFIFYPFLVEHCSVPADRKDEKTHSDAHATKRAQSGIRGCFRHTQYVRLKMTRPSLRRLPGPRRTSGQECRKITFNQESRAHSNGNCYRFSRYSLLIPGNRKGTGKP